MKPDLLAVMYISSVPLSVAIHLAATACTARLLSIPIRQVQYGMGPTLFSYGRLHVKSIPIGGQVELRGPSVKGLLLDDGDNLDKDLDQQPVWKQICVPLAGCGSLVLFGLLGLGMEGWSSFVRGFTQVFEGALFPLGAAQTYLHAFTEFASTHSLLAVWALVASKMAAINLLPFGAFSGGHIVTALLRGSQPEWKGEKTVVAWGVWLSLALVLSWLFALGAYSDLFTAAA